MLRWLLVACLAIGGVLPPSAAPAIAAADGKARTQKEFRSFWRSRLDTYQAELTSRTGQHKKSIEAMLDPPFQFAEGDQRLAIMATAALGAGETNGRGMMLSRFLQHLETKPSLGLTQAWLQTQFDRAKNAQQDADTLEAQTKLLVSAPQTRVLDLLVAMEAALLKRGEAIGMAEELMLLTDNWSAYAGEYARADVRDQDRRARLSAALGAMAASLRANQGWTAQCHRMGAHVSCSGR